MKSYSDGLIISRVLSALGDLENISSSTCPDLATFLTDPELHLLIQLGESIECVCRQYGMDAKPIMERLNVFKASSLFVDGEPWFGISISMADPFQVVLPLAQIKHWFGEKA